MNAPVDVKAWLAEQERKELLRFITCGSVDDGKSTLIGRLLYDSRQIFDDQLSALEADSKRHGTQGERIDFALLVDGLSAEREQGITIDVAYRFFSTETRKFIVADTPGHEQYTRNMVTGASTADAAVILIDARKGVLTQTRRHSYLVGLIGIRHVVLAVNKMDLVGWDQAIFDAIVEEYADFAAQIGIERFTAIPMSALNGDNITEPSASAPWYGGPPLMTWLEQVQVEDDLRGLPFRMPVQWVNRPNLDFRGFSGLIVSGTVNPGDRLKVLPSGRESRVERIVTMAGDLDRGVLQPAHQRRAVVPGALGRALGDVVALQRRHRDGGEVLDPDLGGELAVLGNDGVEDLLAPVHQVHLVDRQHEVVDAEQPRDAGMPLRLRPDAIARVNQQNGDVSRGGAGRHVARVLLVPGRVGQDELAP